jgi:GlpG protein
VRHGEVWRLVTPMFIHFGIFHILFNMMWLRDLGSMFEARLSSWYLALFVVVTAAFSNWLQFIVTKHVIFGGMSGVVYALIGYVWIRGRFDPAAGMMLDKQNLIWALIFFVLCFTGLLGAIANYAHFGGLAMGMAWALVDSKRR